MFALKHFAKHSIGVIAALVGSLRVIVVHPRIDDHLACGVIAEEQAILLKKFSTKPVLVFFAQGIALPVLDPAGVLRNDFKRQLSNGGEALGCVFLDVADRVLLLEYPNLLD